MSEPSDFCIGCINDEYPESLHKEVITLREELNRERDRVIFDATRLRVLATKCGVGVPDSDEELLNVSGVVLGSIRRVVEGVFNKSNELQAKLEAVTKERDEALERIKASQPQDASMIAYLRRWINYFWKEHPHQKPDASFYQEWDDFLANLKPVIPPTEADLLAKIEGLEAAKMLTSPSTEQCKQKIKELTRKIAEQQAVIKLKNDALELLQIASCNCQTKTHEYEYHQTTCPYAIATQALEQNIGAEELTKLLEAERKKAVPTGWKLVPIEPTKKMREDGLDAYRNDGDELNIWNSMIEAAPQPEDKP